MGKLRSSRPSKEDIIAHLRRELADATRRANEVPGLSAALDEARYALEQVKANRACGSNTCAQIAERVLSGKVNATALRVLAARVPLLEALVTAYRNHQPVTDPHVVAKLTALDEKAGGS